MNAAARWARGAGAGLALIALATLALSLRAAALGEAAMAESDEAFDQGALEQSLADARRAALAYAPGAPHVERAYRRMTAIGLGAESAARPELARRAWQTLRGAVLDTEHLWAPHPSQLALAEGRLAALARGTAGDGGQSLSRERLAVRDARAWPALLLLAGGLVGVIVGAMWVACCGVGAQGTWDWRRARWGLGALLVGAACWTLAVLGA